MYNVKLMTLKLITKKKVKCNDLIKLFSMYSYIKGSKVWRETMVKLIKSLKEKIVKIL